MTGSVRCLGRVAEPSGTNTRCVIFLASISPLLYSIARPDNEKLACVLRAIFFATKNVHILRCRPLGRLVLPVRDASSSPDFFARGRRQDSTLDKGEYHVEALGRSAAYIRLKATVSEMSSRANSCIVKIKLCFFFCYHHQENETRKKQTRGSKRTSILRRRVRYRFLKMIGMHRRVMMMMMSHRRHGRGVIGRG